MRRSTCSSRCAIEFETVEVLVQPGRRLVYLDRGLVERRLNLAEARVVFGERVEPANGTRQAARERLFRRRAAIG